MRIKVLVILSLVWLATGATCLPLVDDQARSIEGGKTLAIVLTNPSATTTLPEGATLRVQWTASNLTGDPATVTIILESRTDLSRTELITAQPLDGTGDSGEVTWDTEGASGPYVIIARIETASTSHEDSSPGLVTVDPRPQFEFTSPLSNVEFVLNETPADTLTISWTSSDNSATAQIGLDEDINHVSLSGGDDDEDEEEDEEEVRNEIFIAEFDVPTEAEEGSIDWDGNDLDGTQVEPANYYLFAIISDGVNPDVVVECLGRILVTESEDEDETGLVFAEPSEDVTFLTTDPELRLEFRTNQTKDALLDLKVDGDDDHKNGNEITILSQLFVEGDTDPNEFLWDGTDINSVAVDEGIYRVLMVVVVDSGSPQIAEAEGLIFRRSTENQPLIAMLAPKTVQELDPGDFLTIRWRDDDPDETATIRIVLDDDPDPLADLGDQIEILSGREADPDGVQDSFTYQIPASLAANTYYVIAYIDADGDGTAEHYSVAPAAVTVEDPASP